MLTEKQQYIVDKLEKLAGELDSLALEAEREDLFVDVGFTEPDEDGNRNTYLMTVQVFG